MPRTHTIEQPSELLAFLFASWPEVKRGKVRAWLKFQCVTVNGRAISQFNHVLKVGDVVAIVADRAAVARVDLPAGLKICHEDADIIVIEKPEGLLSMATDTEDEKTVFFQLTQYLRGGRAEARERAWMVHRLDRETSGLMVFAKSSAAAAALQTAWEQAEKCYEAVVEGRMREDSGTFEGELNESNAHKVFSAPKSELTRHAITHYKVLARTGARSLVKLTLATGRRHQIRVHLSDAGFPVVGDKRYGAKSDPAKRLALHATALTFPHPSTRRTMSYVSPLPKELARLV